VHKGHLQRLFHSVFFRLLAAIAVAGITMTIMVFILFIALRHQIFESIDRNLAEYVRYLAADIGTPPAMARAAAVAERTGMAIQYEDSHQNWTIPAGLKVPEMKERYDLRSDKNDFKIGGRPKGHFVSVRHGDGQLSFWLLNSRAFEKRVIKGPLILCAVLLIILSIAYLYIRRVMQPVHWLKHAMDRYGEGELDYRVPLKRGDEFQDLAEAVNRMASKLASLLASKEKLMLDVSHELRSPIARLKVAVEMLDDDSAKASLREDLDEMETMVTEILDAARLRQSAAELNLQKVQSKTLIESAVAEFNRTAPGVIITAIEDVRLTIDPQKARTALKNVLDNALKYSQENQKPVEVAAAREGQYFRIVIRDYGIGIPPQDLERVSEPFFRVDISRSRKTGGFGLGLSLCKAIMEAHGGEIHIESDLGQGTRVTLVFPLAQA